MVSLTDGRAGHHARAGAGLVAERVAEAAASGRVIGADYFVMGAPDGGLMPTLENRAKVIRLLREFNPDLVLTHRPNDYHPDHRYASQLVQDAAYMVTVPAIVPDAPFLERNPVIAYLPDDFQKPYPLTPTIAVDVGPVMDQIVAMLDCHTSQFYEWLPFNQGILAEVPTEAEARRAWLRRQVEDRLRKQAVRFRDLLVKLHGEARGRAIEFAEAFEPCEYGSPLDAAARQRLFHFANFAHGE